MAEKLTDAQKLRLEQEKAGWFTSEWGEWRAPEVKVSNEVKDPFLKKGKK